MEMFDKSPFLKNLLHPLLILAGVIFSLTHDGAVQALWHDVQRLSQPLVHAIPPEFEAIVLMVHDGATLTVRSFRFGSARTERIRLAYIDCPGYETNTPAASQPFGQEATEWTQRLTLGATVTIQAVAPDTGAGLVSEVRLPDGRNLIAELLSAGLAWWDGPSINDSPLAAIEPLARAQRRGLWSDPKAEPPWVFRARVYHHTPGWPSLPAPRSFGGTP